MIYPARLPRRAAILKLSLVGVALFALSLSVTGCRFGHKQAAKTELRPIKHVVRPAAIDLTKVQPNEAGSIPILEYHDLVKTAKTTGYEYPAASFRKDVDWLYAHNYRPINLTDYINGKIDVPAGMSPVILTFDDALRGQFYFTPDGKTDPNCAVGILDAFHAQHPDWALKGTFFVLTDYDKKMPPPFYQKDYAQGKLEYLVKEGFEIGNHTVHHKSGIKHWPDSQVEGEFGGAVEGIHRYLPQYNVDTLALPFGVYPKNQKLVISGTGAGVTYHNICALLAGASPAPSPMSKAFNPYRLPRIIPGKERFAMTYWLNELERNKNEKFVSDGDPNYYTVNAIAKGQLNTARLAQQGYHLQTYTGTTLAANP